MSLSDHCILMYLNVGIEGTTLQQKQTQTFTYQKKEYFQICHTDPWEKDFRRTHSKKKKKNLQDRNQRGKIKV